MRDQSPESFVPSKMSGEPVVRSVGRLRPKAAHSRLSRRQGGREPPRQDKIPKLEGSLADPWGRWD